MNTASLRLASEDDVMAGVHAHWMRLALAESRKALPACAPNPPVGCVIVAGGVLVASGYTSPPGQPHAEAMALLNLSCPPGGLTVYVTLEPCSFEGRTPSCAKALAACGVSRVYVGIVDPDPRNQGRGIDILRAAGIAVHVGVLEQEVTDLLSPYLIRSC
jgi:pyrimidine deaminase RibD-like protein